MAPVLPQHQNAIITVHGKLSFENYEKATTISATYILCPGAVAILPKPAYDEFFVPEDFDAELLHISDVFNAAGDECTRVENIGDVNVAIAHE